MAISSQLATHLAEAFVPVLKMRTKTFQRKLLQPINNGTYRCMNMTVGSTDYTKVRALIVKRNGSELTAKQDNRLQLVLCGVRKRTTHRATRIYDKASMTKAHNPARSEATVPHSFGV